MNHTNNIKQLREIAEYLEDKPDLYGGASDDADALNSIANRLSNRMQMLLESEAGQEWRREVESCDTVLGFAEWMNHRRDAESDPDYESTDR